MKTMLEAAKAAKTEVARLTTEQKNAALNAMAEALVANEADILAANALDLEAAKGTVSDVMLDRLLLTSSRIAGMAEGIRQVAALPDPVGRIIEEYTRSDGLLIQKTAVPMGVIAIIYESRPNVTSDAAALALKSGNVCVLRGGKEAFRSANAIVNALRKGLSAAGVTENAVHLVQDTTRASATELMTASGYIDLLIPRGGAGLIQACVRTATVPCIETGTGICHVYVEQTADLDMALNIIENAKTSRPSVCNAAEVLLLDKCIAGTFLPMLYQRLGNRVELRLDDIADDIIDGTPAVEKDFDTEFLDYILAVKCVTNVQEAVSHIAAHSTGHSEAIITTDPEAEKIFTSGVDSAAVYVNASTRFTDGGEFGLGCEMGISTQKLHARGPMGLRELTTYKYVIHGNGHVR
ncbi:MAG: glutamate-5-semialdehyde dehydrogenase [Oscillospiraceae bacterium]|nr:glutamate-5-semialdehyde dehydrogenase [Oscillospiraceae bacterium]MBQ7129714.1 glutamate-5-semialdehyde dehydrogenase [Oscillospiraceae bacterium]